MKKRLVTIILLVFISITMISISGCSEGGGTGTEDADSNAVNKEEKKANNNEVSKKDNKGSRSAPIGLGETVKWEVGFYEDIESWDEIDGLAEVTLNKVYKDEDAINMLYFASESLDDIEEGYTFAVADITVKLLEGDDDAPYTTSFKVGSVSEDGRKSPSVYAGLSEEYEENEYTDLYPGGTVDIKQAFLVPKDVEYLIEIEENISGIKFFNHK